jgi:hypothetical protein
MYDKIVFRLDGKPIAHAHANCPAEGDVISIADRFTQRADHYRVSGPPHRVYGVAMTVSAAQAHEAGGLLDIDAGRVYIDLVRDDVQRPPAPVE